MVVVGTEMTFEKYVNFYFCHQKTELINSDITFQKIEVHPGVFVVAVGSDIWLYVKVDLVLSIKSFPHDFVIIAGSLLI